MLIDAHSHLDKYGGKLGEALAEIRAHRIFTVSNSMDLGSYRRNREIAEECRLVLPTFGVHPWNAAEYADRLEDLRPAISRTPMVGEIGLDFHFVTEVSLYPAQRKVFEFLLQAAASQNKIVNLHTKGAEEEVLDMLQRYDIERAIVHWYSGSLETFRRLLARGYYFTVGVEVFHSKHIQAIAGELPAESILTETDNPGGAEWLTGAIGMPLVLKEVLSTLARLRGRTVEEMERTVQDNFTRLVEGDRWLAGLFAEAAEG